MMKSDWGRQTLEAKTAKIVIQIDGQEILAYEFEREDNKSLEMTLIPVFEPIDNDGLYGLKSETFQFKIIYKEPVLL